MWEEKPYFYYEATEELQPVEFESWWEIEVKRRSLRGYSWDGMKFESRIKAKQYLLKHKGEIALLSDAEVVCKTK